jgi:hypothetical protein
VGQQDRDCPRVDACVEPVHRGAAEVQARVPDGIRVDPEVGELRAVEVNLGLPGVEVQLEVILSSPGE